MTAQIHDSVEYAGTTHALTAIDGEPLFSPANHGLRPVMMSTACYRGFYLTYVVSNDRLVLRELSIRLDPADLADNGGAYPAFEGVNCSKNAYGDQSYRGLSLHVPFTGCMLIGDGFLREHYVHMGFHPAWKYERVHELTFRAGNLDQAHDRSNVAAAVREKVQATKRMGAEYEAAELTAWIASTFDLGFPW